MSRRTVGELEMALDDWQDWHTPVAQPTVTEDRVWFGAVVAAIPHVLILGAMTWGVLGSEGVSRAYAAYLGFLELYVVPVAAVVAVCLGLAPRRRAWCLPVVLSTLAGVAVVLVVTMIVGNGATWS